MSGTGLEARRITLWRGERCLFSELDCAVRPGRLLHIRGHNGAGKTSLMRVLCGFTWPETGAVRWNGRPLRLVRTHYHHELAWLSHYDGLKHELTASENLEFSLRLRGGRADASIPRALDAVGMRGEGERAVRTLSAGQRRRIAFARVLLSGARLWMLDEPFSNLDDGGRALGWALVARHVEEGGLACVSAHESPAVPAAVLDTLELVP